MLSVNASCAGRTVCVARPSDALDKKKPRSRLTKEERKTMVESFINKYQNLNNGKFPSLNLTHKEVGGSFYTVREIVREIIQDNRVLGPGDSASKTLELEYRPEELAESSSISTDIPTPLSISTINLAVDNGQGESFSLSNVYTSADSEIVEADGFSNKGFLESHLSDTSVSQVVDGDKLSGVTDENSGVYVQTHTDPEVLSLEDPGKTENPVPSCEAASMTPLFESVVNGDGSNDMNVTINASAASNSHSLSYSLAETNISSDHVPITVFTNGEDPLQALAGEDPPLALADDKASNAGQSKEMIEMTYLSEVPKNPNSDEMELESTLPGKDLVSKGSETTGTISSFVVDEVSDAHPYEQLLHEKDFVTEKSKTRDSQSCIAVNNVSDESLNGAVSKNSESPSLVFPLIQPNDFKNDVTNTESVGELVQPRLTGRNYSEVKPDQQNVHDYIESAGNFGSSSQNKVNKEVETSEVNPVWEAIKSLLNAVVKFWTE